jgi:hypothetical protein
VLVNQTGQNRQPVSTPDPKGDCFRGSATCPEKGSTGDNGATRAARCRGVVPYVICATLDCYPLLLERLCTFGQPEVIAELIKTLPGRFMRSR